MLSKSSDAQKVLSHIAISGCDDVINRPFFPDRWDEQLLRDPKWTDFLTTEIGAALTRNPVAIGSVCHIAVPKGRHTFRTVTYLSLCDTLKYTALVFSIGKTIEAARRPKSVVFSNRFDARSFRLNRKGYDLFRLQSKNLSDSKKYKIKIITDIANFYDRLNLHKLENILKEIGCSPATVSKLNDILVRWSQQQSFGLPVGTDASRLLAEAMLINVDKELSSHQIKFIRYVDDFRIFCASPERAYEAMQILDSALRREGLFLNSGKTKIVDLEAEDDETDHEVVEFDPIDLTEKIEKSVRIATGKYGSRIAKFYKYPGKDTVLQLTKIDLDSFLINIRAPASREEDLKLYVKAAIYADSPSFSRLKSVLELYPHLIPYICDAIVKESSENGVLSDPIFHKKAVTHFRGVFKAYKRNDYFRIQAARLLCALDEEAGAFLSSELLKLESARDVLFSQVLYLLDDKTPRSQFLDMLSRYFSLGYVTKTSLALLLTKGGILKDEERKAQIRHLSRLELDAFLKMLLRP